MLPLKDQAKHDQLMEFHFLLPFNTNDEPQIPVSIASLIVSI